MEEVDIRAKIVTLVDDAEALAEYWVGTPYESLIRTDMDALLDRMSEKEAVLEPLLNRLEITLEKAREESERSTNEG